MNAKRWKIVIYIGLILLLMVGGLAFAFHRYVHGSLEFIEDVAQIELPKQLSRVYAYDNFAFAVVVHVEMQAEDVDDVIQAN